MPDSQSCCAESVLTGKEHDGVDAGELLEEGDEHCGRRRPSSTCFRQECEEHADCRAQAKLCIALLHVCRDACDALPSVIPCLLHAIACSFGKSGHDSRHESVLLL